MLFKNFLEIWPKRKIDVRVYAGSKSVRQCRIIVEVAEVGKNLKVEFGGALGSLLHPWTLSLKTLQHHFKNIEDARKIYVELQKLFLQNDRVWTSEISKRFVQ